ncbi:Arginine/lysine/ornithine decarboxylase [Marininema mesophilum]|uniref:Arginine/lysine/ornithine decarboxylase n=1 Tax=Marininema mesophilum TaxID=1048340 RepID=A0A1H2WWY5_9BACL|nr:aminotransferase class I/II-fold pyridoxal phosphate-dependent enzyme [Marininema mesophilum]SDW85122.1 Arginine/lysine/ornithine decarboxylase [Marininema mesophilum]
MEKQERAPIFTALVEHQRKSKGNFHVPGHKQGQAFDVEGRTWFDNILPIDLTEIGQLDDLHQAEGVIKEAQELAAEAFGAQKTYFLTGGTTAGNLALVMALCNPGERLIVQRDCHQSIFNGCALAGAQPIYLSGRISDDSEEIMPLLGEDLERALDEFTDVKGVFITSPDYFGRIQPIKELAEICHHYDIPLVVDEAHGAHFSFHPDLPASAMVEGADATVQSTHKMLPALTMASMLHLQGTRVNQERLEAGLRTIQSSSPSYPMLASLDLARRWMVQEGTSALVELLPALETLRTQIAELEFLQEIRGDDPLKLTLQARNGVSGLVMLDWLKEQDVFFELADHRRLLASFSVGTTSYDLVRLAGWLRKLDQAVSKMESSTVIHQISIPILSESQVPLGDRGMGLGIEIPLTEAVGRVAATMVVPYPPGIPLVLPGEKFSKDNIHVISAMLREGGRVRGLSSSFPLRVVVLQ